MALLTVQQYVDKAARRAGHLPETLTPEQIDFIRENFDLLLSRLVTRGINLWKVTKFRMGVIAGQKVYTLPVGTERVLNINYVTGLNLGLAGVLPASTATSGTSNFLETVGVKLLLPTTITLTGVNDVGSEVARYTFPAVAGWTYFDVPVQLNATWTVTAASGQFINVLFMGNLSEIPMAPLNRDDYWNLPNKEFQSNRPLQYWFDRQITPQISLWPVGNDETVNINMLTFNQINSTAPLTLSDTIDVPQRWEPAIMARLAAEAAAELPNVQLDRIAYLEKKADALENEVNDDESDDMPIYLAPNISHYTS